MKPRNRRKKKNTSGQALVEYALLLMIAAGLAVGFYRFFFGRMQAGILTFNAVLESELRTGEFPSKIAIWEN